MPKVATSSSNNSRKASSSSTKYGRSSNSRSKSKSRSPTGSIGSASTKTRRFPDASKEGHGKKKSHSSPKVTSHVAQAKKTSKKSSPSNLKVTPGKMDTKAKARSSNKRSSEQSRSSKSKHVHGGSREKDADGNGTPKKKVRVSGTKGLSHSPASTVTTSSTNTRSPGKSLSSPDSHSTSSSIRSRDKKTSSVMKKLNLSEDSPKAPTKPETVSTTKKLNLLSSDWTNSIHLFNLLLGSNVEMDKHEFLSMDFEEQLQETMALYKPKELLCLYSALCTKLNAAIDIDAFQTRAKGEKALIQLLKENKRVLKKKWHRYVQS